MPDNLTQPHQSSEPLQPKRTSAEPHHPDSVPPGTYPRTHVQAAARIRLHWQAREYAAAADYAALAHTLAVEAGDVALAAKYAHARQLAHKYQALRVEMRKISWQVSVTPILEPDDPASSEARCNMVCTPDRPEQLPLSLTNHDEQLEPDLPDLPGVDVAHQHRSAQPLPQPLPQAPGTAPGENTTVNRSESLARCQHPREAPAEIDIDGTVCCFPITCPPWRRKR